MNICYSISYINSIDDLIKKLSKLFILFDIYISQIVKSRNLEKHINIIKILVVISSKYNFLKILLFWHIKKFISI